jgi:large subunit ribosomal protein L9
MVEVILLERIERLGQMGDVVRVKPGFARNYLLPKKKALRATKENLKSFEARKTQLVAENLKRKDEAQAVAGKMANIRVAMVRQAGETGLLYGSVTARDIAEELTAAGYQVNRTQVVIDKPIKTTGVHGVRITLHPEVQVGALVSVAQTKEEATAQLAGETPKAADDDEAETTTEETAADGDEEEAN